MSMNSDAGAGGEIVATQALTHALAPLTTWLAAPDVTEICINRPRELFVEGQGGWRRIELSELDAGWCMRLVRLVAHAARQHVGPARPLLSAGLPGGARLQAVLPPAVPLGRVSLTIRRAAVGARPLESLLAGSGPHAATGTATRQAEDRQLAACLAAGDVTGFLRAAIRARRNVVVSGRTGSGKTTLASALLREVDPSERLVAIEDAPELALDAHPNHVRLLYARDGQGQARVTPRQLVEAALRMRPDRILLAELRGEEAFDYLRVAAGAHPGAVTSVHAASCALAFEQMALMVRQGAAGGELSRGEVLGLLARTVDIVIQLDVVAGARRVREVWFGPRDAATLGGAFA